MDIEEAVRASGGRMTAQRRLILDALSKTKHHTTAEDLAQRVRRKNPRIDSSTVYRNLEALEALGEVRHTHIDGRVTRWHRTDVTPHGHLVCRSCGAEQEVALATLAPFAKRLRTEHGFNADLEHAAIAGICRRCAAAPS